MAPVTRLTPAIRPPVEVVESAPGAQPPSVTMTNDVARIGDKANTDTAAAYVQAYKTDYAGSLTLGLHVARAQRELPVLRALEAQRSPVKGSFLNAAIDNIQASLDYDLQDIAAGGVAQIRAIANSSPYPSPEERRGGLLRRR